MAVGSGLRGMDITWNLQYAVASTFGPTGLPDLWPTSCSGKVAVYKHNTCSLTAAARGRLNTCMRSLARRILAT
jgi:hypothetical protein